MESTQTQIVITDPVILDYFAKNPHVDPTALLVSFIDIIKQVTADMSQAITNANITQILSRISDLNGLMGSVQTEVVSNIRNQTGRIENIILTDRDKLGTMLSEKNTAVVSSTVLNVHSAITEATNKYTSNMYKFQQDLQNQIKNTDDKTISEIRHIRDNLSDNSRKTEALATEVNGFLNKYRNNSSLKGGVSERELYTILQQLFPTDELLVCSKTTASCDICVNRADHSKPSILFENKDYGVSVDRDEIKKFERDLNTQRKHGIFISQNSPITFKSNFHIDIIDGLIHLYLPNANYDLDRLRVAVDIIDHLAQKIQNETGMSGDVRICSTELGEILQEYKNFATRKTRLLDYIRTSAKVWTEELDAMVLPRIQTLLINTGNIEKCELTCSYCSTFTGKNKASLGAHMKSCKSNPNPKKL